MTRVFKGHVFPLLIALLALLNLLGPYAVTSYARQQGAIDMSQVKMHVAEREDLKGKLPPNHAKATSELHDAIRQRLSTGSVKQARLRPVSFKDKSGTVPRSGSTGQIGENSNMVHVYVYLNAGASPNEVDHLMSSVVNRSHQAGVLTGWVSVENLEHLLAHPRVKLLEQVRQPLTRTGSKLTEGDVLTNASAARTAFSVDGQGVKVGVISDGVDSWLQAAATGDLPSDVVVLSNSQGGDEGTAMLEIIHDLAPGAKLFFHDHGGSRIGFIQAIDRLIAAGCKVICDDIGWLNEPFFEDGIVAKHIESVIAANDIVYVSAAGNDGNGKHFQGDYYDNGQGFHDFSYGTSTIQNAKMEIPSGARVTLVLQWNDRFGLSGNDYDLYLIDSYTREILASSTNVQSGSGNPLEIIDAVNVSSSTLHCDISIRNSQQKAAPCVLELFSFRQAFNNHVQIKNDDTVFGHPACTSVLAVGAVESRFTDRLAIYSSRGPSTIYHPYATTRKKPDVVAPTYVSVTGVGGFSAPFQGTSASAPHVAAVAALLRQKFPGKNASEIRNSVASLTGSDDMGPVGHDTEFGYGLVNAYRAFSPGPSYAASYECTPPTSWEITEQKTWTVKVTNTGRQRWTADFTLNIGFDNEYPSSSTTGWQRVYMGDLAPGESRTSQVTVTGPCSPGSYTLYHRIKGVDWFSDFTSTPVTVSGLLYPIVTESLTITPAGPYTGGQTVTARFVLKNRDTRTLKLGNLSVGGRLNNDESIIRDFPHMRDITLGPGEGRTYQGQLTLESGHYKFFPCYFIQYGQDAWVPGWSPREVAAESNVTTLVEVSVASLSHQPPIVTESLEITAPSPMIRGQTIQARFKLKNRAPVPIILANLTVGGRRLETEIRDFPHMRNITLQPGEVITYQNQQTMNESGLFTFFPCYRIAEQSGWLPGWSPRQVPAEEGVKVLVQTNIQESAELHLPAVVSSLTLTPSGPYRAGQQVSATFALRNRCSVPITLENLTVGGRLNSSSIRDFSHIYSVTMAPGETVTYQGVITLEEGHYRFVPCYKVKEDWYCTSIAGWSPEVIPVEGDYVRWIEIDVQPAVSLDSPIITESVQIAPAGPYLHGQRVRSTFVVKNRASIPVTLKNLTTGGRLNGNEAIVRDFPHQRDVLLQPGGSHRYDGEAALEYGQYTFFAAYNIAQQPGCTPGWSPRYAPNEPGVTTVLNIQARDSEPTSSWPRVSHSLNISPGPYFTGNTVSGGFTLHNPTDVPITFDNITIGGRRNGDESAVRDFPHARNVTIPAGGYYSYSAQITINESGHYTFFVCYKVNEKHGWLAGWSPRDVLTVTYPDHMGIYVVTKREIDVAQR